MDGRTASLCLAHAREIEAKQKSLRSMLKPYAKTLTRADFVEVIVLEARPDSCRSRKKERARLTDICVGFDLQRKEDNLRSATSYCLIVDTDLSASVKEILSGSIPNLRLAANFRKSIKPAFGLAMRKRRQSLSVLVETALDSAEELV